MKRISNYKKEINFVLFILLKTGRRCKLGEILDFERINTIGSLFASEAVLNGVLNQFGASLDIKLFFHPGFVKLNGS
jgi:hypothetical protein